MRGGGQGSCWRGSPILLSSGPDSLPGRRGGQRISRGAALPLSLSQVPLKDQLHLANRPHPFSSFPLGLRSNHSQGKNKQQTLRTKRMGKRPRWLGDFSCSRFVSGSSWPDAGNVMEQGSRGLWSFPKGCSQGQLTAGGHQGTRGLGVHRSICARKSQSDLGKVSFCFLRLLPQL